MAHNSARDTQQAHLAAEKSRLRSAATGKPHCSAEMTLRERGQGPRWSQAGDVGKTLGRGEK